MKKYPKYGRMRPNGRKKGLCLLCKQPQADSLIDVEINDFRGDDEVYKVHVQCTKGLDTADLTITLRTLARHNFLKRQS